MMATRHRRVLCATVLTGIALATGASAQGYPFSQRGSVTQNVALTAISVEYGRPVARGRVLFGQLVPWDSIWHPGADSATRITFDHDVLLEGKPLSAGEYSLWLIPRQRGAWTVIVSKAAHTFHKPYPGAEFEVLRLDVTPLAVSHMESFAIYFPMVLRDEAELRLHWGTMAVPIRIKAPYRPPDGSRRDRRELRLRGAGASSATEPVANSVPSPAIAQYRYQNGFSHTPFSRTNTSVARPRTVSRLPLASTVTVTYRACMVATLSCNVMVVLSK